MEDISKYRMAVISGMEDEDGLIRYFGETDEYRQHLDCLKDYLYTYYNDLAKQIGADDLNDNLDLIIYLNTLGDIVYLHSPGYGLLFVPKEISKKQIESLYELLSSFEKTPIYIDYNLVRKNGKVIPEEIIDYPGEISNTEVLDRFLGTKPYIKKPRRTK